jgi:hypothetical protein
MSEERPLGPSRWFGGPTRLLGQRLTRNALSMSIRPLLYLTFCGKYN